MYWRRIYLFIEALQTNLDYCGKSLRITVARRNFIIASSSRSSDVAVAAGHANQSVTNFLGRDNEIIAQARLLCSALL
jgi:hypothetical protein